MKNSFQIVLYSAFIILITSKQGRALNCYVCDSATDVTCGESLPYFHSLLPIDCADTLESPQYCIKQTGLYEVCDGLLCYQCDSSESRYCPERLPHSLHLPLPSDPSPDWYQQATSCDHVFEAQYCIKTTGSFGGLIGTKRFCSARNFGNFCEEVQRPGDERTFWACVYTCSGNSCNAASTPHSTILTLSVAALSLLKMVASYW